MAKEKLYQSYLTTALTLIGKYTGKLPLAVFLRDYFSSNKKYGSRDRKNITTLCYCFYRTGHALEKVSPERKLLAGLYLCSTESTELLKMLEPVWDANVTLPINEKMALLYPEFILDEIFPWGPELTGGINIPDFCLSHLVQPDLFLRIRPGYREKLLSQLAEHSIVYEQITENCLAFPNGTKLEKILSVDCEVVVQDLSSQKTGGFLELVDWRRVDRVWDCCAASGGKSIMAYDRHPGIKLTVSDIRENSLVNLRKRFAAAGITQFKSFVTDLSEPGARGPGEHYPFIIADIPCTGSGTWSRTPDQLFYFKKEAIAVYASLQKRILANAVPYLAAGGYLLYITCSVFKSENEEIVEYLQQEFRLQLIKMELIQGYTEKADSLFAALLKKEIII